MPTRLHEAPRHRWALQHWSLRPSASCFTSRSKWPTDVHGISAVINEAWIGIVRDPHILAKVDAWGMTPLHVAARRRCLPLCRLLISEKALVDAASDQDRWTPLH